MESEDNGFARSAAPALAPHPMGAKVTFIHFNNPGHASLFLRKLRHAFTDKRDESIHGVPVQVRDRCDLSRCQIKTEELQKLPKFGI